MSEQQPVSKLAHIRCKPGQADAFRAALLALETATRKEPGCQEFRFFQALSDEGFFILLEQFENEAALQLHLQATYTQSFFALGWVEDLSIRSL